MLAVRSDQVRFGLAEVRFRTADVHQSSSGSSTGIASSVPCGRCKLSYRGWAQIALRTSSTHSVCFFFFVSFNHYNEAQAKWVCIEDGWMDEKTMTSASIVCLSVEGVMRKID